jgi:hypothetical protein
MHLHCHILAHHEQYPRLILSTVCSSAHTRTRQQIAAVHVCCCRPHHAAAHCHITLTLTIVKIASKNSSPTLFCNRQRQHQHQRVPVSQTQSRLNLQAPAHRALSYEPASQLQASKTAAFHSLSSELPRNQQSYIPLRMLPADLPPTAQPCASQTL